MARQIFDAKLDDLRAKSGFALGFHVWYSLLTRKLGKQYYEVKGPSRITEFREWNGKLQIKLADNDACWIYAKLCFHTPGECIDWNKNANNTMTMHGEIA